VGAQTRRTENNIWHSEDILELHPHDADERGIKDGELIKLKSRKGETTLHAKVSERMQPGVVYTTFHMPETGANVITTEYSDWATNCPEYKVTAVQVEHASQMSEWQKQYLAMNEERRRLAELS
jgi:formate dehydrogenase major subunit